MKAGFGRADITPLTPGLTLSGFASRMNKPSIGVHDPIMVRALALQDGAGEGGSAGTGALLLAFDLLAIGAPLAERLHAMLDKSVGDAFPRDARVFCCTHTHSAPAAIRLIGCGIEDQGYWDHLIARAREATLQAVGSLADARLWYAEASLPGINFNRHIVLKDGRVVMSRHAPELVAKQGNGWDTALFAKLTDEKTGAPIAALMHWAAHPTTAITYEISADFPGALCRELEACEGVSFMFLQGACGDVSIPFKDVTFDDTQRAVRTIMEKLPRLKWREADEPPGGARGGIAILSKTAGIRYQPPLSRSELAEMRASMEEIARGGRGNQKSVAALSNILNVPPGGTANPEMLRYIASILAEWARDTEASAGTAAPAVALAVKALRVGPIIFAFAAAEVFVETAYAIAALFPKTLLALVGYAAPLVGYLPTDDALKEGGYEAEYAYRFYGHPAPFAAGSEQELIATVASAVRSLLSEEKRNAPKGVRRKT
jgi:neutral ceramidase